MAHLACRMAKQMMLEGIRIVDLSSVVFGPYATQMLADMGAEVIKVEPPGGETSRFIGKHAKTRGMGALHMTLNRGKKSIELDLKSAEDAALMRKLLKTADVFIHNVRGKAITKLGFGYEAVKEIKPDIIYVHCTGFGQNGPYRDLQAYDDVIQAATGVATLLPRADGNPRPRYLPSLIADKVAGHYGAQAMLAALIHKLRTGEGQLVEVPMFEAFATFNLTEHMQGATFDPPIGSFGYYRQLDPGRQPFPTADGYISLVPYTDAKMGQLFTLLGGPEVLSKPEFAGPVERFRNATALYEEIARLTPAKTTAEWMEIFVAAEFPAMPVRDLAQIFDDPHLIATDYAAIREHPTEGRFHQISPPIRFGADKDRVLGFSPALDQDGAALRRELEDLE